MNNFTYFKNLFAEMSLNELEIKRSSVQSKIAQMIFDPELVTQLAVLDDLINQKKDNK